MSTNLIRAVTASLLLIALSACNHAPTPARAPTTNVNPITGTTGAGH